MCHLITHESPTLVLTFESEMGAAVMFPQGFSFWGLALRVGIVDHQHFERVCFAHQS
jgi:hypothetical protein